jgi:hypothetical protein
MDERRSGRRLLMLLLAFALFAASCGSDDGDDEAAETDTEAEGSDDTSATDDGADDAAADDEAAEGEEPSGELTPVSLQLQWFTQAQFAGYYAAVDQGFYEDVGPAPGAAWAEASGVIAPWANAATAVSLSNVRRSMSRTLYGKRYAIKAYR